MKAIWLWYVPDMGMCQNHVACVSSTPLPLRGKEEKESAFLP